MIRRKFRTPRIIEFSIDFFGGKLGDIKIEFTGLRSGEKLYEELLIDAGNVEKTKHERILKSFEQFYSIKEMKEVYVNFEKIHKDEDRLSLYKILENHVDGFIR